MFFLLNQGFAACVGIAAQFYHRTRRQRPKDDLSIVFYNALFCAYSYGKSSSFKIIYYVINVHRFDGRHSTILIVS